MTRSKSSRVEFGGFRDNILNAGIVVGRIEPPESSYRPFHHGFHLNVISDVALHGKSLVPPAGQFLDGGTHRILVRVGQHHRSARFGKSLRGGKTESGSGPGNEGNLVFKRDLHNGLPSVWRGRFAKTSFAIGIAEKALGQPA